jgi:hypothetical protein
MPFISVFRTELRCHILMHYGGTPDTRCLIQRLHLESPPPRRSDVCYARMN